MIESIKMCTRFSLCDVGVQGKLKDNLLDVLKHGWTESTTDSPWHSPRPCSHPGSFPAKCPVLCIQFANLSAGKLLIFLYSFAAFEVSFQVKKES